MKNTVFTFLGTTLDQGTTEARWNKWRPSVSLVSDPSVPVDCIEFFLTSTDHVELLHRVSADILEKSPLVEINAHILDIKNPWDFEDVYSALHDFSIQYDFAQNYNYFVHLATGSHVAQICLYLLTQNKYFPAKLLDSFLDKSLPEKERWRGKLSIIDLDVSTNPILSSKLRTESVKVENLLKQGIETKNARYNALIKKIEMVCSRSAEPVLLSGATGCGKSQLAKQIYLLKSSKNLIKGKLVEINCATLTGSFALSALFGHKKGSFTGASADRVGALKEADGGVLFLDEIGELGLEEQAFLLKALEQGTFCPLGSDKEVSSSFCLIAGTNKNLAEECKKGTFRLDLFNRLNTWSFTLPSLKERLEDLLPNIQFECKKAEKKLGKKVSFDKEALELLLQFASNWGWSGNFRELSACILRMATLSDSAYISKQVVQEEIDFLESTESCEVTEKPEMLVEKVLGIRAMDSFELATLENVLKVIKNSKTASEAGRTLFAVSRLSKKSSNDATRLTNYLKSIGLGSFSEVKSMLGS